MAELNPATSGDTPSNQLRRVWRELDRDGKWLTITRLRESVATVEAIAAVDVDKVSGSPGSRIWTRIESEPISDLLCWKVTKARAVPGNTITIPKVDEVTGAVFTSSRTLREIADITAESEIDGTNLIVTYSEPAEDSSVVAWEIIETIPLPAAHDEASAIISTKFQAQQFPGRIDLDLLDAYGTAIGYKRPWAQLVPVTMKTWWEFSEEQPEITFDLIITDTVVINGVTYSNVLHDYAVRLYPLYGVDSPVELPATTPDYTTYVNSWIGTQRLIDGEVTPERWQKMWKVVLIYCTMR